VKVGGLFIFMSAICLAAEAFLPPNLGTAHGRSSPKSAHWCPHLQNWVRNLEGIKILAKFVT